MTEDETDEHQILMLMTPDTHKFGVEIGYSFGERGQAAFERLMLRDWIRLIDFSPVSEPAARGRLMRVFRVMPDAVAWFRNQG